MTTDNAEAADAAGALWKVAIYYDCLRETLTPLEGVQTLALNASRLLHEIHEMTDAEDAWTEQATLQLDQCFSMVKDLSLLTQYCPTQPSEEVEASGSNARRVTSRGSKARPASRRNRAT